MTRQILKIQGSQDEDAYMSVATPRPDPAAFRSYMERRGVPIDVAREDGPIYKADYRQAGLGRMRVGYMGPGRAQLVYNDREALVPMGAILIISGLQQQDVEHEADEILKAMGEVEDMETIQYFIVMHQRHK